MADVLFIGRRLQPVSTNKEEETEYVRRPSAPPAYTAVDHMGIYQAIPLIVHEAADREIVGSIRTSNHVIIVEEEEHHNRAVPINYDDHFDGRRQSHHHSDSEVEEQQQLDPFILNEESDRNDSTETIPSIWEPTPSMSNISMNVVFVRSQSEERVHRASSTSQLLRLPSDPEILSPRRASVGGESYSHRHVRLSQYRSNSQTINRAGKI